MDEKKSLQIERALQEWISALDVLRDAIFLHDKDYRILRCNKAYQALADLPFEQIIGRPYFGIFPKMDGPLPHCKETRGDSHADVTEKEVKIGETLFRSRSYAIYDEEHHYRYSIHILENITVQRLFEQKLREHETFMTTVLDSLPVGVAVNTGLASINFTYMNDKFPSIYRTSREAIETSDGFWDAVYEDPVFREKIKTKVLQDITSGDVKRMRWKDVPLTRKGEETTFISAQNVPLTDHDAMISTVWDVTDRKHADDMLREEKRFSEKLIESIPDLFFLLDSSGKLIRWNRKLEHLFDITPQKLAGYNVLKFIYQEDRPSLIRHLSDAFEKGSAPFETRVKTVNGPRYYTLTVERINTHYGSGLIGTGIDITERKKAEMLLQRERDFTDNLIETAPVIILILDTEGQIVRINRQLEQLSGYTREEVAGKDWFDTFFPEQNRENVKRIFRDAINETDTRGNINTLVTRSGEALKIEWSCKTIKGTDGRTEGLLAIGMDVTEQRRVQERLELFHTLFDHSMDAVEIIDPETFRLLDVNATECEQLGYTREELLGMKVTDIDPTLSPEHGPQFVSTLGRKESLSLEGLHRRRDGTSFPVEVSTSLITVDKPYILSIIHDISERKASESALRESEEQFRTMTASAQDAILMMDHNGNISYWNEAAETMFGYTEKAAMDRKLHDLLAPERYMEAYRKGFSAYQTTGKGPVIGKTAELVAKRKNGHEFPIELSLSSFRRKGHWHAIGIIRDISERKASEAALERANRALRTLSRGNLTLVRATNEKALLKEATKVIIKEGGYSLAVVAYVEETGDAKRLKPVAWAGFRGKKQWIQELCWSESELEHFPAGIAVRQQSTQICRNISQIACSCDWKHAATTRGYVANIVLPLQEGERVFGVLSIYSTQEEPFDRQEVKLLEELAGDLAYGILNLRTRAAQEEHETLFHESMEQTIQAIAATVESRDPYTAGHQKRVAELAAAIAREMGLTAEQTEGVWFAATIHDLGKLHIPAEILSKPGRLTDLEYQLVKTHSQAGYDIIKDVQFPWPIAEIILQHHECLDGSGYPRGLKGDEILIEAQIITVADIVEAISSHRPYRSAMGIERAFTEIEKGRGSLYDPNVVDACITLFRENRFAFTSKSSMMTFE